MNAVQRGAWGVWCIVVTIGFGLYLFGYMGWLIVVGAAKGFTGPTWSHR